MIEKKDVKHIADLAKLHLDEKEMEVYTNQLGEILQHIEKVKELEVSQVEPTTYIMPTNNVLRKDKVKPSLDREKALQNAPSQERNYFKVPKVIEE